MPQMRKLLPKEVQTLEYSDPVVRARIAGEYDAFLQMFEVGDYGIAEPLPDESRLAVRRRLAAAAERRGWQLTFLPSDGEALIFQVQAQ